MKQKNVLSVGGSEFVFSSAKLAAAAFELLSDAVAVDKLCFAFGCEQIEDFPRELYKESEKEILDLTKKPVEFASDEQIKIEIEAKSRYKPF